MKIASLVTRFNQDCQRLQQLVAIATSDEVLEKLIVPACVAKVEELCDRCHEILKELGDPTGRLAANEAALLAAEEMAGANVRLTTEISRLTTELARVTECALEFKADLDEALGAVTAAETRAEEARVAREAAEVVLAQVTTVGTVDAAAEDAEVFSGVNSRAADVEDDDDREQKREPADEAELRADAA